MEPRVSRPGVIAGSEDPALLLSPPGYDSSFNWIPIIAPTDRSAAASKNAAPGTPHARRGPMDVAKVNANSPGPTIPVMPDTLLSAP